VEDGATGATGPVTQFTLTLTKSGGPPDALTGAGTYNAGDTVNIVAPNPDSASNSFLQWSGAWPDIDRVENVNNNSTFVTMTGDTSLIADY
jgi:sulfite reductase alpha subunit-like flavoprotein